ncbi:ARF/SAR [Mycena rosella]|uniref:Small COPII coat GTPase SAR1 n=1 Tax=Mycena rosella TaxID=1033263 RepID=A0AAD7GDI9_MYCRO|nr:ARF/SAR [Mycena rosella]
MFVIDQFWWVLAQLGLVNKNAMIPVFGLNGSGVTALFHMLKTQRFVSLQPTLMPTWENFTVGNLNISTFDLGSTVMARRRWPDYFHVANAIAFLVDSANSEWFPESKAELDALLANEELSNVPFLIFGNKIDLPGAVGETELKHHLGLSQTTGKGKNHHQGIRPIEIFMCSVKERQGYEEGFRWVSQYVGYIHFSPFPRIS